MLHLAVTEQEDCWRCCAARLQQDLFEVLPPLCYAIVLCDLNAEQLVVSYESCKAGQALTPTAANADLHRYNTQHNA